MSDQHEIARQLRDSATLIDTEDDPTCVQRWLAEVHELSRDGEDGAGASPLRLRGVDLARVRPITWLWKRRLPFGYLALLLGAEGVGKGTLAAWIIARATRGELPGNAEGEPIRVLVIGDEDDFDSVIVPRLYAAGADLGMVDTLEDEDALLDVRRDAEALRETLLVSGHRLVYIDHLLDVLGLEVDDWRSKPVRDSIRPLRRLARELDVCALATLHPNKGARTSFRDLIAGTHAFNAASRSSLLLAPHPDDRDRRVLVRGKGNLSVAPLSFEFGIESRDLEINGYGFSLPIVAQWEEGELGVEDVLKPDRQAPVRDALEDQIDVIGTGEIQTRTEIARLVGREPDDRSVGRALDKLEDDERWAKEGRGKWRKLLALAPIEGANTNKAAAAEVEWDFTAANGGDS